MPGATCDKGWKDIPAHCTASPGPVLCVHPKMQGSSPSEQRGSVNSKLNLWCSVGLALFLSAATRHCELLVGIRPCSFLPSLSWLSPGGPTNNTTVILKRRRNFRASQKTFFLSKPSIDQLSSWYHYTFVPNEVEFFRFFWGGDLSPWRSIEGHNRYNRGQRSNSWTP